jgi:D-3-phosphoglycerate dehydrogenase
MKVLVSDPIAKEGIEILQKGAQVDVRTGLSKEELISIIPEYDALVVRSETKVTPEVIEAGRSLKVIGRAGVGVDNIAVDAATRRGIIVVNSPEGNTIAAAEHTMALILALSRNIPQAVASLRTGEWKRSKFVGVEVYGKTLGIIGLGKIGREVAKRAKGFAMEVIANDPFITTEHAERLGVRLVELEELLRQSDYVSLHVPINKDTRMLLSAERIAMMKPGARLINCARGGIVDEKALLAAVEEGRIAGAALDVFEKEPPDPDDPILKCEKIIVTPHLGASTMEAQIGVAVDVAEQILNVLSGRPARSAVNLPYVPPEVLAVIEPFLPLAERMGRFLAQLVDGRIGYVEAVYKGDLAETEVSPLTRAVLKGILEPVLSEVVTYVNAPIAAENRGIRVVESKTPSSEEYTSLIEVTAKSDTSSHTVSGTIFGKRDMRIVELDGYRVDLEPEGYALISRHMDRPGIIGRVGTALGQAGINIAGMHVGRKQRGQEAVMILNVDDYVPPDLVRHIASLEWVNNAKLVDFSATGQRNNRGDD